MSKWKTFSKKKKTWIIVLCIVLVAAIGLGIYFLVRPDDRFSAEIVEAQEQNIVQTINPTATIEASDSDNFTLAKGTVPLNVNVEPGDRVKQGDILATFDLSDLREQVSEKQQAYDKALSAYNAAVTSNQTAKQQLTQIESDISALESKIESLQSQASVPSGDMTNVTEDVAFIQEIIKNMTPEQIQQLLDMFKNSGGSDNAFNEIISGSFGNVSELVEAQSELVKLQAQKVVLQAQSAVSVADLYKVAVDTAQQALSSAQDQLDALASGWVAQKDGLVTAVNITEGEPFGGAQQEMDLSGLLSSLTSGEQMDSSSIMQMVTQMMDAANTGMTVSYDDGLQAVFSVGKYDVLKLHVGQEVKISSVTGEFTGKIEYISPTASTSGGLNISSLTGGSASSANVTVRASIDNPDESIIIGFDVDIEIATETAQNAVAIPMEALYIDGSDKYVYVLNDDNTISKRSVTTGIASETMYQIVSGLKAGEKVVRNPSDNLTDGEKVNPVAAANESTSTNN